MVNRIGPAEAFRLIEHEGYAYVDVRSVQEFDQGHPKGSHNIPIMLMGPSGMQPNANFSEVFARHFEKNAKIVLGCKSGGRSQRAAEMLAASGFTGVVDQRAGWDGARDAFGQISEPGWRAAGLPSERAESSEIGSSEIGSSEIDRSARSYAELSRK